jgi:hypothetical protein
MKKILILLSLLIIIQISFAEEINVYDVRQNKVTFQNQDKPQFLIFHDNPSCHACMLTLCDAIKSIDSTYKINLVIRSRKNIISNKESIRSAEILYKVDNYYFDSSESASDMGLFGDYKIKVTPALIIITAESNIFINYNSLFGKKYSIKSIIKLLKEKLKIK